MSHGEPVLYSLYIYAPNTAAPIFFTIAYAVSAIAHLWQCHRHKSWKLIGLHPVCAVLFTLGYALRCYGAQGSNYLYDRANITPLIVFILSQVFIFVCPPLLELANYHLLGRIFHYAPHQAPMPANRVLAIFGGLMVIVEILNALGVTLTANPTSSLATQNTGKQLALAALSIQIILIVVFLAIAGLFHRRCSHFQSRVLTVQLATMYTSMVLIFVRCIYRLVEHAGHTHADIKDLDSMKELSLILRYEVFFYVFEASLMLLNSALWNVWHPGRYLPQDYHVHLARDGTEVVGTKMLDGRSTGQKVLHVVTFGIMYGRKSHVGEFQELGDVSGVSGGHQRTESSAQLHPSSK